MPTRTFLSSFLTFLLFRKKKTEGHFYCVRVGERGGGGDEEEEEGRGEEVTTTTTEQQQHSFAPRNWKRADPTSFFLLVDGHHTHSKWRTWERRREPTNFKSPSGHLFSSFRLPLPSRNPTGSPPVRSFIFLHYAYSGLLLGGASGLCTRENICRLWDQQQ